MFKRKRKYIYAASAVILFSIIAFIVFLYPHSDTKVIKLGSLDNYTPIALNDKTITYNYISNNDALTIGSYNIDLQKENNIVSADNFYITYGIPAQIQNKVYLPITLNNMEHKLLQIDMTNNSHKTVFTDNNSEPFDSVSTMNDSIFMLSGNTDKNGIYSSYIRKYNAAAKQMEPCIREESIGKEKGRIIKSFACHNDRIYTVTEEKNGSDKDIYINVYDGREFTLLNKLNFNETIKSYILNNDIVQFYLFGDYIYIRDFSDTGIIGHITENSIKDILALPQLRIAYNSRNTNDDYYVFFMREGNEIYILDMKNDDLRKSILHLSENESIRNAISDGNNICVSILDDSNTDSYVTKETYIYSYEDLLKSSN